MDIRSLFSQLDTSSLPITTAAVAKKLECPLETAEQHLSELATRGVLQSTEITGGDRIWWRSSEEDQTQIFGQQPDREEFSAFVSAVKDYAIFKLDPDGIIANWNDGAERIKGYTACEIVGEHFSVFYTDDDVDDGVPEQNLEAAITEGRTEDEGWRVRKDGSTFWADVTITAIRDDDGELQGFTKVTRDMTEQRQYEHQLRQERDVTEQILGTVPVSICLVSTDGEFIRANQQMLDHLDIEESELSEYDIFSWDVYDADGEQIPKDEWPWTRAIQTGETVSDSQCQVDLPDIGRRWLSLNAAPLKTGQYDNDVVVSVDDITEQKEHERQLRRESEQTEKLLRTAPMAIAVQNADGETVLANQQAQEALGVSEQQFIEKPDDAESWEIFDADGNPLPSDKTPAARVLATGEAVFNEELVIDPPHGDRVRFRANAAPIFDSNGSIERVITAAEDITELRERQRQLEQRKSELETELSETLDRVSDAFYALDDEWRFTHLNDWATELLQQSADELAGRKIWEVYPDMRESIYGEKFQTAMDTQEPVTFEVFGEWADAWLEFNVYPSESGLSIYFRDITERKEYQQKLEESNERLEQFAYAASHDLQEPLRMVTSYLQLLESRYGEALDEDAEEFIEFAVDGAERMREMIDGLLEYSRVETQGDPFEPIELDDVLTEVYEDLQLQIEENDAEITAESLPCVEGDRGQLRQLFQNLLGNAIEYSGDEPPDVDILAEQDGQHWRISVRDHGIGIDPDDADRVFEVFQRLHSQEDHPGTGIGLALCRRIVERHGGEICVESDYSEGATFSFTLPVVSEHTN